MPFLSTLDGKRLFWRLPLRETEIQPCSLQPRALVHKIRFVFSPPRFIDIYKEAHPVWYLEGQWSERELISKFLFLEICSGCFMTLTTHIFLPLLWAACSFLFLFSPLTFCGWPMYQLLELLGQWLVPPQNGYSHKILTPEKKGLILWRGLKSMC